MEEGGMLKMKRRWKGVLIACGVLGIAGAGMCIAAAAIGVDRADVPSMILPHVDWLHGAENSHHGDTGEKTFLKSYTGIDSLDIRAEAVEVEVKADGNGSSDQIQISTRNIDADTELDVKKKGSKLVIDSERKGRKHWLNQSDAVVTVTIPNNLNFKEVKGSADAGSIWFEKISCEKLDLDVDAGAIDADTFSAGQLKVECDAGSVELYQGNSPENIKASCSAGAVTLGLAGDRSQYDYEMKASAGDISIDGESVVSGLLGENQSGHGNGKSMKVECMAGSIDILFD